MDIPDNRNKKGKWIKNRFREDLYTCSECDVQTHNEYWYCPGCGAKMEIQKWYEPVRKDEFDIQTAISCELL